MKTAGQPLAQIVVQCAPCFSALASIPHNSCIIIVGYSSWVSGINFLSHSVSLAYITLLIMSHSLIHLTPAHHSHPPSHVHCFIPGSELTFSQIFCHSLLAPTRTAFSDYAGPDFLVNFLSFYFWSCSRLSWFNWQLSKARKYRIITSDITS